MKGFLFWIGWYNALGALALPFFLNESYADTVLRNWLKVIVVPYSHGAHGPLWIWWSMMTNLFLGVLMVRAADWEGEPQLTVAIGAVGVYVVGIVMGLFGMRSKNWDAKNVAGTMVLWVAQIAWGVYAILTRG